jgi:hypothetical protein
MQWDRSNTIGIAKTSCCFCHGNGMRIVRKRKEVACSCVHRSVFRACWNRFRECAAIGAQFGTVSWEKCPGPQGRGGFSRKREEYMADFCLVSRRALDEPDYRIFRYHYLLGAPWKLCCRQLKMDRGNFFHAVYRIEQTLGQVFAELEPYALYPLRDYFNAVVPSSDLKPTLSRAA